MSDAHHPDFSAGPREVPKIPVPASLMEARAQGRAEALAIILGTDPDSFCHEHIFSGSSGCSGEISEEWDADKLRELLRADETVWSLVQEAEGEYWHNLGLREEAERERAQAESTPGDYAKWRLHANGMFGLLSEIIGAGALRSHGDDDLVDRLRMAIANHEQMCAAPAVPVAASTSQLISAQRPAYVFLLPGDTIRASDEYLADHNNVWLAVGSSSFASGVYASSMMPIRRLIARKCSDSAVVESHSAA